MGKRNMPLLATNNNIQYFRREKRKTSVEMEPETGVPCKTPLSPRPLRVLAGLAKVSPALSSALQCARETLNVFHFILSASAEYRPKQLAPIPTHL